MASKIQRDVRVDVLERDGFRCQGCGDEVTLRRYEDGPTGHVHHQTPLSRSGTDDPSNLITLCPTCHTKQHDSGVGEVVYGDLRPVDRAILSYLREDHVTPRYCQLRLAAEYDEWGTKREYSRGYIQERLARFVEHGHVRNLYDTGLYELVDDPEA